MKFQIVAFISSLVFITHVTANPQYGAPNLTPSPSPTPEFPMPTCVLHCGGPNNLACPGGYRCCGPIVRGVGGQCFPEETGICPF